MADTDLLGVAESPSFDLRSIKLLLGVPPTESEVFAAYIEHVANDGLLPYKAIIQFSETGGGKAGESLYTHVLNGITVLEQLRRLLHITDIEAQVLFTAYTIHDLNKVKIENEKESYKRLAVAQHAVPEIIRLQLDAFFPDYVAYLDDILSLIRRHSAHLWVGTDSFDFRRAGRFQLGAERLGQLVFLIRAADGIDLSKTLDEQRHKEAFLVHINNFSIAQYTFITHRVSEQRGSFTNLVHNAVMAEMQERFGVTPLLIYPDGVAYLCPRGREPVTNEDTFAAVARRITGTINDMTSEGFLEFIRPTNMGITIDKKCLDLGISFGALFDAVYGIVQRRAIKADKLERLANDSIKRTRSRILRRDLSPTAVRQTTLSLDTTTPGVQRAVAEIEALLAAGPVPQTPEQMRIGELIRSYYIFLLEHFASVVPEPWTHIYRLLDLPSQRAAVYDGFDARMDRAYAIATELPLPEEEVITRIKRDGAELLTTREHADPRFALLTTYLQHVLLLPDQTRTPGEFASSLASYVRQQHKQCVQCNLPLPTEPWMAGDVRSDIKVQSFSNRLGGGPGEPKKRVCGICHVQFLVEKLNYREIRGEQAVYLHLFPYSFLTAPFLNGLRTTIKVISRSDSLAGALRLTDVAAAIADVVKHQSPKLTFTTRTNADNAQPYGVYLPRYSDSLGGVMTFPINPAGENDTQKFLFVLQHALLLQRHLGCKVLASASATPSLDKEAFGDVYFDLTPLSARGLIQRNDYYEYTPGTREPGTLSRLWDQLGYLFAIRRQVAAPRSDDWADLVEAMAEHPLRVFFVAEKLAESKARAEKATSAVWTMHAIGEDVRRLALSLGGREMQQLDAQLQRLAEIAWRGGLRGQSLEKNSLMAPLNEVLAKVSVQSAEIGPAVLEAAAAQDLYEHIERIRKTSGRPYSRVRLSEASQEFVRVFFEGVFAGIYSGKPARLLAHEKLLRSAFHFYIRQQIPHKAANGTSVDTNLEADMDSDDETDLNNA